MRNFKFRAWNNKNKKMIYSYEVYPKSKYKFDFDIFSNFKFELMEMTERANVTYPDGEETFIELYEKVESSIMQYTGLKDVNGKEIYEGDIVDYYKDELGVVKFVSGCFVIDSKNYMDNFLELMGHIKVIGNIYENPELLK